MPPVQSKRAALTGIHQQLELVGLEDLRNQAGGDRRQIAQLEAASRALAEDFSNGGGIAWTHSGWCLAGLPHSRPAADDAVWHRQNGRCHLLVEPGSIIDHGTPRAIGVPYGALARVILLYLQTHVADDGTVPLGRCLSAWLRKMQLPITGAALGGVREQVLRLARARISLHWTDADGTSAAIVDRSPVDAVVLLDGVDPELRKWREFLVLSSSYRAALIEHRVPLAENAIAYLKGSAMALDLYLWLAYRLRRVRPSESGRIVPWAAVAHQLGASFSRTRDLARQVTLVLKDVLAVYPGARVEPHPDGLRLWPSPSPVPVRR